MTQGDLAEAVGVTHRLSLGLIEAGKVQSLAFALPVYLQMLRKTLDQLFWEEDENKFCYYQFIRPRREKNNW